MSPKKIAKIRSAVEECQKAGGRARYCEFVKLSVQGMLREGMSPTELSNSTGVGLATIFKWSSTIRRKKFRKVKVSPDSSAMRSDLRITFPSGICVECSSTSALKSILECLK